MSPAATSSPLITEVTSIDTPIVEPTSPLALSRRSSGTRTVTSVDRAMPRMFPAMTPIMARTMKTHRTTLLGSAKASFGVSW